MVLGAGTYAFSRAGDNPNIVRISSPDGTRVFATLLTVSDYRMDPGDETIVTFEERPNGNPKAIKSWFYPGDNTGEEFIYRSSSEDNRRGRTLEFPNSIIREFRCAPPSTFQLSLFVNGRP